MRVLLKGRSAVPERGFELGARLGTDGLTAGRIASLTGRRPGDNRALRGLDTPWPVTAPGPVLGVIKIAAGEMARVLPERDGHAIRRRFKSAAVG